MKKQLLVVLAILFFCTVCTGMGCSKHPHQNPADYQAAPVVHPDHGDSYYEKVTS